MRIDIFGKLEMEVVRQSDEWRAFYCGNEGKKRKAQGVVIPASFSEIEVVEYIDDLFHEWATPSNSSVRVITWF